MFPVRLMDASLLFLVTLVTSQFGMSLSVCQTYQYVKQGTTDTLEEIFRGRCAEYKTVKDTILPKVMADCNSLWKLFRNAFASKHPCNVTMKDYEPFMEAAKQQIPKDKALFWSKAKGLAHAYAEHSQHYITLEDTMIGYLANNLQWCGTVSDTGINYEECPSNCSREEQDAFWGAASRTFASWVSGEVTVMLEGSCLNRPAYDSESYFARHELPYLDRNVTKVTVLLTRALGHSSNESCDNGTLALLKTKVESANMTFDCKDKPQQIHHLLCVHFSKASAQECSLTFNAGSRRIMWPSRGIPLVIFVLLWSVVHVLV